MKSTAYRFAVESGATRVAAWLKRRRAAILTYHGLLAADPPEPLRPLYKVMVTADAFREQMQILRGRYRVVTLDELARRIAKGDNFERLAAVTFDDGWKTTHSLAAPILHELGLPATVFVATGLMGTDVRGLWTQRLWWALFHTTKPRIRSGEIDLPATTLTRKRTAIRAVTDQLKRAPSGLREERLTSLLATHVSGNPLPEDLGFMRWDDVRELPSFGVSIGAHTVDHEILSCLPIDRARDQVRRSKLAIEEKTASPCRLFAYPNGSAADFTEEHAAMLRDEGFLAAVTQIPGRNSALSDCYRLRRTNVGLEHTLSSFIAGLDGLRHWT